MSFIHEKRERSNNFTQDEVDILMNLVEINKHILESKKCDAVTWNQKRECWKNIEVSFNAASGSTHRTTKNLRLKYEGLKRDERKKSRMGEHGGETSTASILTTSEIKKDMSLMCDDDMEGNYDYDSPPKMQPNPLAVYTSESDLGEASSETNTKWPQWKTTSLKSRKHSASSTPKLKRPSERITDCKMEIVLLQKKILEEEYENNRHKWAFEAEERQHKREMWVLERKMLLRKLNE